MHDENISTGKAEVRMKLKLHLHQLFCDEKH